METLEEMSERLGVLAREIAELEVEVEGKYAERVYLVFSKGCEGAVLIPPGRLNPKPRRLGKVMAKAVFRFFVLAERGAVRREDLKVSGYQRDGKHRDKHCTQPRDTDGLLDILAYWIEESEEGWCPTLPLKVVNEKHAPQEWRC